ncbi:hypothetical protein [Proteiniphilum sp. X52]|uniref:hypothetical protein n=1 Tax=Proteiniphilum sp. X52 TaxID=2382159 RepID=UPI0011CDDABA|nr:hypothetical protein [Proteiniphilum sp. X52]
MQFTYQYYFPGSQGSLIKETEQFLSSYFASGSIAKPVYMRGKFIRNRFNDGLVTFPGNYSPYTEIGKRIITKWPFKYTHELYGSNCGPDNDILIAPGLSFFNQMHTIKTEDGFQTISAVDVNGDGVDEVVKVNFHGVNASANASRPYQVTMLTPTGTAVPVREQSVTYTSYQRPNNITENGITATFAYNAGGERVKMQVAQGATALLTRYYIGKKYELDAQTNTERLYLGGDVYSAPAVYVKENNVWKIYYIFIM